MCSTCRFGSLKKTVTRVLILFCQCHFNSHYLQYWRASMKITINYTWTIYKHIGNLLPNHVIIVYSSYFIYFFSNKPNILLNGRGQQKETPKSLISTLEKRWMYGYQEVEEHHLTFSHAFSCSRLFCMFFLCKTVNRKSKLIRSIRCKGYGFCVKKKSLVHRAVCKLLIHWQNLCKTEPLSRQVE